MPRKSYFKSSAGLKRSSTILNCRKVARNQGIGMCRNSKRSDQSVGEKEGGLASSMLKARSQDRQTSWFDRVIPVELPSVWPPADVPASRLHAQTLPSMGVHWNGHHGNSRKPVHPSVRPGTASEHQGTFDHAFLFYFQRRWQWQLGAIKDTKMVPPGSGRVAAENFISPARFPRYWPILVANRQRNPMRPSWELQAQPSQAQRPFQGSLRTTSKEPRRCSRPVTPAVHAPPKDTPRCDTATRLGTGCCCTCGWLFWGRGRTSVLTASFPRVRPQRPPKGLMVVDVVVAVTAVIAVELSPVDGNSYPRAWKAERVGSWRRPRPFPTETHHTLTHSSPAKAKERWLRRSNGPPVQDQKLPDHSTRPG